MSNGQKAQPEPQEQIRAREKENGVCIKELQSLIFDFENDESMPSSGDFFYYYGLGNFRRAYHKQEKDWDGYNDQQTKFCERMFVLANDFDMLISIVHKIDWLTNQWQKELVQTEDWAMYLRGDVHLFHAEMRSIFDSIAKAAFIVSGNRSGQLGKPSFNGLQKFCKKNDRRARSILGTDLTEVIMAVTWFEQSRAMRDSILHYEKDAEISYVQSSGSIVFRTLKGTERRDIYRGPREFSVQDGWILLRPYLGYYLGRLWFFLNSFCKCVGDQLVLDRGGFSWAPKRLQPTIEALKNATG